MATTQYIPTTNSNGTSNLTHLLSERDQQVLRLIQPRDLEKVFGPGEDINIPEKGYTDPEWYFLASDGCVWGIGWRWGHTRLRGRGGSLRESGFWFEAPSPDTAAEFLAFINRELSNK